MKEPKVNHVATYTMVLTTYEGGGQSLERTNDGFNAYELLGTLELTQRELVEQLHGRLKPKTIKRKVVE